jgi:hypothetical protein
MPDFTLGKIYIIKSPNTEQVYIGSTAQKLLSTRMAKHRWTAENIGNCSSKIVIDAGGAYIELIEKYGCADKTELNRREGQVAATYPTRSNKQMAGRTKKESNAINNNLPKVKAAKKAHSQTPEAKAVAKAYASNREVMDKLNAAKRAKTAKKREDALFAAIMITDGNQNI